jgi:hypothetical protein
MPAAASASSSVGGGAGGAGGGGAGGSSVLMIGEVVSTAQDRLYYVDAAGELLSQTLTLLHMMLVWWHAGLHYSLTDLFLGVMCRATTVRLYQRVQSVQQYRRIAAALDASFSDASLDELRASDDVCAICLMHMARAKKLPCGHLFHAVCLQAMLRFKTPATCPKCRAPLTTFNHRLAHAAPPVMPQTPTRTSAPQIPRLPNLLPPVEAQAYGTVCLGVCLR